MKTAVYCRVSNKHTELEDSLENQIRHYTDLITGDPGRELAGIYYDFGISGYKEHRPGFQKMLTDGRSGLFRQILTKSITRFARNTYTVLTTTRELKEYGIGVYFELQKIDTLSQEGELLLTLYAAFGQAESDANRVCTQMAIRRKWACGRSNSQLQRIFCYSRNADGTILPDKNALHVTRIFEMAADGVSPAQITKCLNESGIKTQNGKQFHRSSVTRILRNVEYKGDFIGQNHYVDENRRLRKNYGELPKYYFKGDHIPIVSEDLWNNAQSIFDRRKHNGKKCNSNSRQQDCSC